MAISTFQSYLMIGSGSGSSITWTNPVPVKESPDLGAAPEPIEVTTQSDPARTFIPGIENTEQKTYVANYDPVQYDTLKAMEGSPIPLAHWYGASYANGVYTPDGHNGKFVGEGYLNVFANGGGINDPVNMTITLSLTKNFVKETTPSA